jgi:SET domain-containing protein
MECMDRECNCGDGCQNQRFQKKEYADVSVIKTEKKGFGLRANSPLEANDFIFEYIGEVINEPTFRRRMVQYDDEGIKHFYFMSLSKGEFVDATKKGNLGRFCNHSCDPNCYVDKWIVGEKVRMGIFALRRIRVGEELVFNYNVDRYGADPQPCYCGEPNCTGYIGGKTQTERATKLPVATIEALGIDDGDSWDTAVAKRPRKKKTAEDDEDYVNSVQPRGLDEAGVTKVMAALAQCKEKWIAVKLLERIQNAEDDRVRHQVVRMHGYQILKTTLDTFMDDTNVVLQILDILYQLPRLTKNKVSEAKVEGPVEVLASSEHEDVSFQAKRLLDVWSKLETAYRIPRQKVAAHAPNVNSFDERRNMRREEEISKPDPFASLVIPKGPRSNVPQRAMNTTFFGGGPRPRKVPPSNLPAGWFIATDPSGAYYFYNKKGETTWRKPTAPAIEIPTGPSKVHEKEKALQDIINSLTKEPTTRHSASQTPQRNGTPTLDAKEEKWRSLPTEKQMKIYENTVGFPSPLFITLDRFC